MDTPAEAPAWSFPASMAVSAALAAACYRWGAAGGGRMG
jgi:hypothetical protein